MGTQTFTGRTLHAILPQLKFLEVISSLDQCIRRVLLQAQIILMQHKRGHKAPGQDATGHDVT